jgi:hypothetical protein
MYIVTGSRVVAYSSWNSLYTNVSWLSVATRYEYWCNIFKSSPCISLCMYYYRHSSTSAVVTSGRSGASNIFRMRMYLHGCLVKIQNSAHWNMFIRRMIASPPVSSRISSSLASLSFHCAFIPARKTRRTLQKVVMSVFYFFKMRQYGSLCIRHESFPPQRYAISAVETVWLGNLGIDLGCDSLLSGRWCSRLSPISNSGHITERLLIGFSV